MQDNTEVGIRATLGRLNAMLRAHDEELWEHLDRGIKINPQFYAFRRADSCRKPAHLKVFDAESSCVARPWLRPACSEGDGGRRRGLVGAPSHTTDPTPPLVHAGGSPWP